ncbi:MAG TPA: nitroreductase family protein [Acidimicrobiales bacterium]|jgi:nitroreductase|nr:nitroreductase family protein [Acidimicrobiales bacterium]
MEIREALRTTGAVRAFDGTPVDRRTIYDLLDTARFAPSGGNRQCWRVIVVEDPGKRRALRDAYLPGWYEYLALSRAGLVPFAVVTDRDKEAAAIRDAPAMAARSNEGGGGFAEHLDEVPVLLVVLADLRSVAAMDRDDGAKTFVGGASVYPFAWSILLAARDVGLGGVLTTMVRRRDAEVRAIVGCEPFYEVACVIALGRPAARPTRLTRSAVETFATIDTLDGAPLEH